MRWPGTGFPENIMICTKTNDMTTILFNIIALITGLILGGIFFGGLWFTVKKGVTAKIPALWFIGSFIIRVGTTLGGFYLVGAGNLIRMLICLGGFIIARFVVVFITKTKENNQITKEA